MPIFRAQPVQAWCCCCVNVDRRLVADIDTKADCRSTLTQQHHYASTTDDSSSVMSHPIAHHGFDISPFLAFMIRAERQREQQGEKENVAPTSEMAAGAGAPDTVSASEEFQFVNDQVRDKNHSRDEAPPAQSTKARRQDMLQIFQ